MNVRLVSVFVLFFGSVISSSMMLFEPISFLVGEGNFCSSSLFPCLFIEGPISSFLEYSLVAVLLVVFVSSAGGHGGNEAVFWSVLTLYSIELFFFVFVVVAVYFKWAFLSKVVFLVPVLQVLIQGGVFSVLVGRVVGVSSPVLFLGSIAIIPVGSWLYGSVYTYYLNIYISN